MLATTGSAIKPFDIYNDIFSMPSLLITLQDMNNSSLEGQHFNLHFLGIHYLMALHTYIIGHYNPFSQDYGLASHTTHVGGVIIIYVSDGTYSITWTLNDRFLRNFFMTGFIYSQSFCQKSAERKSPKKYFVIFGLVGDA